MSNFDQTLVSPIQAANATTISHGMTRKDSRAVPSQIAPVNTMSIEETSS
jgi:hypothetical protein